MARPTLVVVSGPPGSGKTTLAHAIARAIPCPAICRDEIKEGIVHAEGGEMPEWGGPVSQRTHATFFGVIRSLVEAGVTVVAEAAFQDERWRPDLEPLAQHADVCVVHCTVDASIARDRISQRATEHAPGRAAHPDRQLLEALDSGTMSLAQFDPISLFSRAIHVDTTDGYRPGLEEIVAFINAGAEER